jgi:2-dehydropantoate 2-reductase
LEESVAQLKPCIAAHTIILPLQNGVDNTERVAAMLQEGKVIKGCAYIVSKIIAPAVIQNSGNIQKLYFGANGESDERLAQLETIFKAANIDAYLSPEISKIVWEKFIFISATATATSYFNCSIGQLLQTEEATLLNLIEEVRLLAQKKGMQPDPDIVAQTISRLRSLPFETTSSMHRDLLNGNKEFEIASLTAYVVKEAEKLNLLLPTYTAIYKQLIRKYGE